MIDDALMMASTPDAFLVPRTLGLLLMASSLRLNLDTHAGTIAKVGVVAWLTESVLFGIDRVSAFVLFALVAIAFVENAIIYELETDSRQLSKSAYGAWRKAIGRSIP